jgi:hypothetical protein
MRFRAVLVCGTLTGCAQIVGIEDLGGDPGFVEPGRDAEAPPDQGTACASVPSFGAPTSFGAANATALAVGDLDNDGLLDVAYADGSNVFIFRGRPQGGLGAPAPMASSPVIANSLLIADLDGDGLQDLVTWNAVGVPGPNNNVVSAHRQSSTTPGTFRPAQTFTVPGAPGPNFGSIRTIVLAPRLDDDPEQRPDLVVSTMEGALPYFGVASSPGTFSAGPALLADDRPLITVTDVDGDTFDDVVFASAGGLQIIFNKTAAPGTFDPARFVGSGNVLNAGFGRFSAANAPRKDVVLVSGGSGTAALFVQNGPRTFVQQAAAAIFHVEPLPADLGGPLAVIDINGDGTDDVISGRSLAVQCAAGTFYPGNEMDPRLHIGEPTGKLARAFADLDANGKLDFVELAGDAESQFLKVYLR